MYTLINCQKQGCEQAQDSISIQIKEGDNGDFKEFRSIAGRSLDTKWIRDTFTFIPTQNKIYVI